MSALNAIILLAATVQIPGGQTSEEPLGPPLYQDLGNHHFEVSTDVTEAQAYFDQGLRLYYAFNHEEAIRSFREAQRLDPACAMCVWGEALAMGPNINLPMDPETEPAAHALAQRAFDLGETASERERGLITALAVRYSPEPVEDRTGLESSYSAAMGELVRDFPDEAEFMVLFGESRMNLRPWNYWTEDGTLHPDIAEAVALLERVLEWNPEHPGACHFFIHAVEEHQPERAVPCAERLAALMPGAGHLVHMPGHIYIRVGRYLDAITANEHAVHADETFIRDRQPDPGIYTVGYYPHNYDFLAFAAAMAGREEQSLGAARQVADLVPREMLRLPGMAFLQGHMTRLLQLQVRFERWQDILETNAPEDDLLHARGIWHYAMGRALAATGDVAEARAHLVSLQELASDPRLDGVAMEFNESPLILAVASQVLEGSIAAVEERFDDAEVHLREAARLEDSMVYGEPPEWSLPVRHDLATVLLTADRAAEAEQASLEDLARFPENGWSLRSLAMALRAQGRVEEAVSVEERLSRAW